MAIQYKKFGDLLKICMEKQYSTFTMEQLGLIARTTNDGNKAVDKMIALCKDSKTEKQFLQKAQKLILNVNDKERLCPVINKIISMQDCFDACMVLEDGSPKRFALSEIVDNKDFEKTCKDCFYYKNL